MAILVLTNENEETVFTLDNETSIIGRKADCDIILRDKQVSKYHAKVLKDGPQYRIEDMESRNGTCVNGKRIKRVLLREGDRIKLAETVLLVYHVNEMQQTAKRIRRDSLK